MISDAEPEDRPRGPSGGAARRPEREREERARSWSRSPPRRASTPAPPVRPADTWRSRSSARGAAGSGRGRSRRGTASPSPGRPASAPARGTSPTSRAPRRSTPGPASSSESVVRANATATAPTSVPSRSTAFPNHTGHAEPRPRLERLPVDPARVLGPVVGEDRVRLDPGQQAPEPERPQVGLAGVDGGLDALEIGRDTLPGRSPAAPRLTRVRALGCSLGRAPGPRSSARNDRAATGGDHLEEHHPRAVRSRGSRVRAEHARRPLPRRRSYRRRRHGRGLPRPRRGARTRGGDQGPAPAPRGRRGLRRTLPAGGTRRRRPQPPEHRGRPRLGRRRRHLLHGDGVRRRARGPRDPERRGPPRPGAGGRRARADARGPRSTRTARASCTGT